MAADGRSFDWSSYRGQTVLVMVWSAACPGCRVEMPVVARLHDSYRDSGLEVVGVNLDRDPNVLGQYLADAKIPWTNLHGPAAQELVTRFGIPSTPYFLLIGTDGKLITVGSHVTELAVHIDLVLKAHAAKSSRAISRHIADEPGAREESAASREAGASREE